MKTTVHSEAFHAQPAITVAERLGVDPGRGLATDEAEARLARFGANAVTAPSGPGPVLRLLRQFHDPLIYVLLLAGVVTAAFGGYVDAGVIGGVVVLNAVVGFVQESRAQRALEALSRMLPLRPPSSATASCGGSRRIGSSRGMSWSWPRGTACRPTSGSRKSARRRSTSRP